MGLLIENRSAAQHRVTNHKSASHFKHISTHLFQGFSHLSQQIQNG